MTSKEGGFTLIEILAVIVILGIITGTIAVKLSSTTIIAEHTVISTSVKSLNSNEKLTWHNLRLSSQGYINDALLFTTIDYDLGEIQWVVGPTIFGGSVKLEGVVIHLGRIASTSKEPAKWIQN